MATDIVYNDFRSGQIDEQFGYRTDMQAYATSASKLENVIPFRAGGLTLREGTSIIADAVDASRVIDFCVSATEHYFIALSLEQTQTRIHIYGLRTVEGIEEYYDINPTGYIGPWSSIAQLEEIQYVQDYEKIIFAQKDHPPFIIRRKALNSFETPSAIVLDKTSLQEKRLEDSEGNPVLDEDGKEQYVKVEYDYADSEGRILFEERDYPACVTFAANRLIFANSIEHPYRIWISKPFLYNNFQTVTYYPSVSEDITSEEYLKAIENYTSRTEDLGTGDDGRHRIRRVTKNLSTTGKVTIKTATYIVSESGEETLDPDVSPNPSTDEFNYTQPKRTWEEVITEDCAMILDIASNRDERIAWIGYVGDMILVGSSTSEWAMPSHINATSVQISKVASYGSMDYGSSRNGAQNIFYVQSGGRHVRAAVSTQQGFGFLEPSYPCESIIKAGIKEMHWQRVPEPRLYCVLRDGSIAVLSYDLDYGMNAWVRWTTEGRFLSLCVVDTAEGQEVITLVDRDGTRSVERFEKGLCTDHGGDHPFKATVITNCIDSLATMKRYKKVLSIACCSGGTRFLAGQDGCTLRMAPDYGRREVNIPIFNKTTNQGTRIVIESLPREPFVIHALMATVEVTA